jgi:serine/threonine protein kinase
MGSTSVAESAICPPAEVVRRVAAGAASADEEAAVESHLNQCTQCQHLMDESMASPDELNELRMAAVADGEADITGMRAAGLPSAPLVENMGQNVLLANGLRLGLPRENRFIATLGEYDIMSVVGEGGMGIVLRAWDESLQREVALKVIRPALLADAASADRFLQEARSAARLRHPNILTIYAVGRAADIPYVAMEMIQGKALSLVIAEEGRLPVPRAAAILRQLLAALEHAHAEGLIHRDIKPSNVLVEQPGERVKLVDFGLARALFDSRHQTAVGLVMGTPGYMSPEQLSGEPRLDPRTDLFAVGVVLFELLTGALPFSIRGAPARVASPSDNSHDPRRINAAIPRSLAGIVVRAIESDRNKRYPTAAEFGKALDDFLNGEKKMASPISTNRTSAGDGPLEDRYERCSSCSDMIVSQLGVAGRCAVCNAPLCMKCWQAAGIRFCQRHADGAPRETGRREAPTTDVKLASAAVALSNPKPRPPAPVRPLPQPAHKEPAAAALISPPDNKVEIPPSVPVAPAPSIKSQKQPDGKTRAEEETKAAAKEKAGEEARAAAETKAEEEARAAGVAKAAEEDKRLARQIALAIHAEKTFLREVASRLQGVTEVVDPRRGTRIEVTDWNTFGHPAGARTRRGVPVPGGVALGRLAPPRELGAGMIYHLRRRHWWGRITARATVGVQNLANGEQLTDAEENRHPTNRLELESLLNHVAQHAAGARAWHLFLLRSPTGWTDDARDWATGKGARPFRDPLVSVVLFDEQAGTFLFDDTDEKVAPFKDAFTSTLTEDDIGAARKFIFDYLLVKNSISLQTLVDELALNRKTAQRIFRMLAASGELKHDVVAGVGEVLSKRN